MTDRARRVGDEGRRWRRFAARATAAAALVPLLGATGCEDLIRAGRAATAVEPADSVGAASASEPQAAASSQTPRGRRAPREPAELLGAPAWEGERSAVAEDLQAIFADERVTGAIVVHDVRSGATLRSDPQRAARRTAPGSTFEVLLTLIALEVGVLSGLSDTLDMGEGSASDAGSAPDLASAFRTSDLAFFEEVSRRIGSADLESWVRRVGYGSSDAAGATAEVWTVAPLAISPDEQIGFLRRLRSGELPFSSRSMAIVRELMALDGGDSWSLRGKTGWRRGSRADATWFVGWVERGEETAVFAIEFENEVRGRDVQALRERVYRRILTQLGLVPARR